VDQSAIVLNSIIEAGIAIGKESVVSHCHLQVPFRTVIPDCNIHNGTVLCIILHIVTE